MMDRALKERTIGAVVLVVFAVMVVPVFLDGPSNDGTNVQEKITLPGQQRDGVQQKTIVLERDRTQPVPAARNNDEQPDRPAPVTVEKPEKAVESAPVAKKPALSSSKQSTTKVSSTGMWAVQLGSFSNQANADRLAADLRKAGFAAFLSQLQTDSGKLHRVRVGPQKNRASAEAVATRLSKQGQKGQVVPHP